MEMPKDNKTKLQLKKDEQSSYKMIITKELERKIRFICSKIHNIEWSGVLFYTHEGEFEDNSLVIKAVDLIVLDIGDATTTQFQCSNPDVITYMIDNDLLDCDTALVHSHHSMASFMSGVDLNTLLQEGSDRNIFVSLIVNNKGSYTAGITRRIFSKIAEEKCYKTFNDREVCQPEESYETQYVEWFNLNIEKEEDEFSFPEIATRLLNIAEEKKKAKEATKPELKYTPATYKSPWDTNYQTSLFDDDNDIPPLSYKPVDIPSTKKEPTFEVQGDFIVDTDLFDNIVIKLLTGDINASTSSTTITKAATDMSSKFNETFEDVADFESFARSIIDFIMDSWGPFVYAPKNDEDMLCDEIITDFASDLGDRLLKIVPNKYTEIYSNILKYYM